MRQRRDANLQGGTTLQDEDYLEEEEQEEVIEQLEREGARQQRYVKQLLGFLGVFLAAIYLLFAVHQVVSPYGTRHHFAFVGHLREAAVVAGELGGGASVLLATAAVLLFQQDQPQRLWKQLLQLSATLAMLEGLFWGTAVFRVCRSVGAEGVWRLLWLPVAPLLFYLVSMQAINSLAALTPEVAALKASRYRFKRA
ncbi:hypothetical protein N2152v2_009174 [Parachlorella kessleri]